MSLFLKQFENHTQYENYINGSDAMLPNVSLCVQEGDVHYNPFVDPCKVHDFVDLGLPSGTKWATKNVGACSETDYGNYYKYGLGAEQYYNSQANYTGTENPLAESADTATQVWGGSWHMPTQAQFNELTANTTYQWTTINGINGGKFTAQNGNYVFFPAAGRYSKDGQFYVGTNGDYWSSTTNDSSKVFSLYLYSNGCKMVESNRFFGFSVRPVIG